MSTRTNACQVYLVTGANTGVGKELAQILYARNANVWIAARNQEKAEKAIYAIKNRAPTSSGTLHFLKLDLADLSTIKASADEFLTKSNSTLHVLFNNAGVMTPARGSKTAQGYELQLGTNCIGHFMFTKLLTPALTATAKASPPGTVRVVWVSSSAAEGLSPSQGVPMDNLDYHKPLSAMGEYGVSKAGNYYHATEFARRYRSSGIVSVPLNPGNLDSELWRTQGAFVAWFLRKFVLHRPVFGAYTELFAGVSPAITMERSGDWVVPWERFMKMGRDDLTKGAKRRSEGGTGVAEQFWEWNEAQIKPFS